MAEPHIPRGCKPLRKGIKGFFRQQAHDKAVFRQNGNVTDQHGPFMFQPMADALKKEFVEAGGGIGRQIGGWNRPYGHGKPRMFHALPQFVKICRKLTHGKRSSLLLLEQQVGTPLTVAQKKAKHGCGSIIQAFAAELLQDSGRARQLPPDRRFKIVVNVLPRAQRLRLLAQSMLVQEKPVALFKAFHNALQAVLQGMELG